MSTYIEEIARKRRERRRTVKELADGIAGGLGEDWHVEPPRDADDYEWAWISGPGGMRLMIQPTGGTDQLLKVQVSGLLPQGAPDVMRRDDTRTRHINASVSRGGAAIARDVARRLLPDYATILADTYRAIEKRDSARARRQAVTDEVMAMFPGSRESAVRQHDYRQETHLQLPDGFGTVEVYGDASKAQLDLRNAPVGMVLAALEAVAEYGRAQTGLSLPAVA